MDTDPKTLSGTEINALINAGWDGKSPLPRLTDEELMRYFLSVDAKKPPQPEDHGG